MNNINEKLIIITGSAAFLGSHLCRALTKKGNYVICMDNLYTGKNENIADLIGKDNFIFLEHDLIEPVDLECFFTFKNKKFKCTKTSQIYNLACPASPVHYQKNPINTIETNYMGAKNMLELVRVSNAVILQTSTSEVYRDAKTTP